MVTRAVEGNTEDLGEVKRPIKTRTKDGDSSVCSTEGLEGSRDIIQVYQWKAYDPGGGPKKLKRKKKREKRNTMKKEGSNSLLVINFAQDKLSSGRKYARVLLIE